MRDLLVLGAGALGLLAIRKKSSAYDSRKRLTPGGDGEPAGDGGELRGKVSVMFWLHAGESTFRLFGYASGVQAGARLATGFVPCMSDPATYWRWDSPGYYRSVDAGRTEYFTQSYLPSTVDVRGPISGTFMVPAGLIDARFFQSSAGQLFAMRPGDALGGADNLAEAARLDADYAGRGRNLVKGRSAVTLYRVTTSAWAEHWQDMIRNLFPAAAVSIFTSRPVLVEF